MGLFCSSAVGDPCSAYDPSECAVHRNKRMQGLNEDSLRLACQGLRSYYSSEAHMETDELRAVVQWLPIMYALASAMRLRPVSGYLAQQLSLFELNLQSRREEKA